MTQFLSKSKKTHFGPFWALLGQKRPKGIFFFENRAPSLFNIYGPLTSCRKSEKTNDPILRKTPEGQTDINSKIDKLCIPTKKEEKEIANCKT